MMVDARFYLAFKPPGSRPNMGPGSVGLDTVSPAPRSALPPTNHTNGTFVTLRPCQSRICPVTRFDNQMLGQHLISFEQSLATFLARLPKATDSSLHDRRSLRFASIPTPSTRIDLLQRQHDAHAKCLWARKVAVVLSSGNELSAVVGPSTRQPLDPRLHRSGTTLDPTPQLLQRLGAINAWHA